MENPYMYLFIREDLSHPQQIVQTAHAVDELNKKHPHPAGNYMVLCGAASEDDLQSIANVLFHNGIEHEMFFEPDIDAFTAIATRPLVGSERNIFKRFRLMR